MCAACTSCSCPARGRRLWRPRPARPRGVRGRGRRHGVRAAHLAAAAPTARVLTLVASRWRHDDTHARSGCGVVCCCCACVPARRRRHGEERACAGKMDAWMARADVRPVRCELLLQLRRRRRWVVYMRVWRCIYVTRARAPHAQLVMHHHFGFVRSTCPPRVDDPSVATYRASAHRCAPPSSCAAAAAPRRAASAAMFSSKKGVMHEIVNSKGWSFHTFAWCWHYWR